jgi:hypothetical protein
VSHNGNDDLAARLRDEASATAPERLRADVMLRVRAEPRPQRIRPHRSFRRSFVSVAAAACILGALVFGLSRVDFNTGSGSVAGGGASAAAEQGAPPTTFGRASPSFGVQGADGASTAPRRLSADGSSAKALLALAVPRPLRAAVLPRYHLAAPLRQTFAAIDPHHGRSRR